MRVIVFLGIAGLSLAGFRVDRHHVPHVMPHHHHTIQVSEHGHSGHGDSNSENSEELFNLLGALESDIQGTIDTISGDIKGTIDTLTAPSKSTTSTKSRVASVASKKISHLMPHTKAGKGGKSSGHGHSGHGSSNSENSEELFNLLGALESDIQGTIDTISGDIKGTIDTLTAPSKSTTSTKSRVASVAGKKIPHLMPHHHASKTSGHGHSGHGNSNSENSEELFNLIGAIQGAVQGTVDTIQNDLQGTADTITNAVESITPAEAAATGNAIASGVGTGLKLGNSALQDVNDGLGIANAVIP